MDSTIATGITAPLSVPVTLMTGLGLTGALAAWVAWQRTTTTRVVMHDSNNIDLDNGPANGAPGFSSPAHLICSAHDAIAAHQQLSDLPVVTLHEFLGISTTLEEIGDLAAIRKACRVDGHECREAQNMVRAALNSRMVHVATEDSTYGQHDDRGNENGIDDELSLGASKKRTKDRALVRCADALTDSGALAKYLGSIVPEMEQAVLQRTGGEGEGEGEGGWLKKHLQGAAKADNNDSGGDKEEAQVKARAMALQVWCKEQGFVFVHVEGTETAG